MKSEPQNRIGCLNALFVLVGGAMLLCSILLFKVNEPTAALLLLTAIIILILGVAAAKSVLVGILCILFGCIMFATVHEEHTTAGLAVAIVSTLVGVALLVICALISMSESSSRHTVSTQEGAGEQQRESTASPVVNRARNMAIVRLDELDRMSGQEFEKAIVMLLPCLGFSRVQWIGGAGDQGADIIAYKSGDYYAIQCKRYSKDLGNRPVQEVYAGMKYHGCNKGMVITNSFFTAGAKELAFKNGVLLRDRNWLADALEMQNKDEKSPLTSIEQIDAMSGGEFEQYMVEALLRLGFENIQYVGGASGNGVDILAQKNGVQYAIQCNRYQGSVDESTIQEAVDGAAAYECEKAIVITSSHFTKAAEALAERHNALLWDREWLMFLLEKFQAEQE